MKHEIGTKEAAQIRKARAPRPVEGLSSIELEDEAAKGNRAAAKLLEELNWHSAMELRAKTQ